MRFQLLKMRNSVNTIVRGSGRNGSRGGRGQVQGRGGNGARGGGAVRVAGEKGASAHTVHEDSRIRLTQVLMDLRESEISEQQLEFTAELSNTERKFVHELAAQLGLKSKSTGKGEDRRITVRKATDDNKAQIKVASDNLPLLTLGQKGNRALLNHVNSHPPDTALVYESQETGSSLIHALQQPHQTLTQTLDQFQLQIKSDKNPDDDDESLQLVPKHVTPHQRQIWHAQAAAQRKKHPQFKQTLQQRQSLPAWNHQRYIAETIANNSVTILSGDTGCGKSTQVPQFILDSTPTASIVVTQPRRISAITVAERVAFERCEQVGASIGYNIRLERKLTRYTQCVFCTPGVLLRKLVSNPTLAGITHVILDEVHERDKHTEFLMICLKNLLSQGSSIKLVLMSATLQTNELENYWRAFNNNDSPPPQVNIPGRTFPVQDFYLEDLLRMTGFVDNVADNKELEVNLAKLLNGKQLDNTLVCCMCQRSGFKCPEELGTHVATCMGHPNVTLEELETNLRRQVKSNNIATYYDPDSTVETYIQDSTAILDNNTNDDDANADDDDVDLDDFDPNKPATLMWDGLSPFDNEDRFKSTLTEEELLRRYHTTHDDELIDNDLLLEVCKYIVQSSYGDGAILIFFPGWQEISQFALALESTPPFSNQQAYWILPLHSSVPSKDQRRVFMRPPSSAIRKIVLATNIAEASVTIDDVVFVGKFNNQIFVCAPYCFGTFF